MMKTVKLRAIRTAMLALLALATPAATLGCSGDDAHVDPTVPPPPKDAASDSSKSDASKSDAASAGDGASEGGGDAADGHTDGGSDAPVGDAGGCPSDTGCNS